MFQNLQMKNLSLIKPCKNGGWFTDHRKKLKNLHHHFTNFIQILFQVNLNRMWDIWSFFFQLCPTFSFCWDICRFSFDYVPHFPFVGTYVDFLSDYVPFLDFCGMFPRLFFCICPAFGFLWEVSLPFLHMSHLLIPPQNLYQMILICLSTYPVYKFPEQNTLIFLPFRII